MAEVFTHADAKTIRRRLNAMLPETVLAHSVVLNFGRTLAVLVANDAGIFKTYEFGWCGRDDTHEGKQGPEPTFKNIVAIASEWESGDPLDGINELLTSTPATPIIVTKDALVDWVGHAKAGDAIIYFKGSLVNFRDEAPRRLLTLQRLADQAPAKRPRPAVEFLEMEGLQKTLDLIKHITVMHDQNFVTLSQRRDVEHRGTAYLAIRKGRPMAVSHPYTDMKLKKAVEIAIKLSWRKFAKQFTIQSVSWEGNDDKTHDSTAAVAIIKDDPQDPTIVRVPTRDLGPNDREWPAILANKGAKAAKLMGVRHGIKRTRVTLEGV